MAAKACPWCLRPALKDDACQFVVCGRGAAGFVVGSGCGRAWCFRCDTGATPDGCFRMGGKLCGQMYDAETGAMLDPNESHDHPPGSDAFNRCNGPGHCPGGHDSHKRRTPHTGTYASSPLR